MATIEPMPLPFNGDSDTGAEPVSREEQHISNDSTHDIRSEHATGGLGTQDVNIVGNSSALFPRMADVDHELAILNATNFDAELSARATAASGAIAFVHFDGASPKSTMVEALIHSDDLTKIDRGMYVRIVCAKDRRQYSGRVVEGPFYDPDVLKRDSTPVQFIILNQGQGKLLSLPEYHAHMQIELLGEERDSHLYGTVRRPHPASPIFPYDSTKMATMLNIKGSIVLGTLDAYEDVPLRLDEADKHVLPRNVLTVGTVGSGKSNTNQVLIEETLAAGFAQVIVDPEGEYTLMDQPADGEHIESELASYGRTPNGVEHINVYHPPNCTSRARNAREISVRFDSLSPELIMELADMNEVQRMRFAFLYDQAIRLLNKQHPDQHSRLSTYDDPDLGRGYPGITLGLLLYMLNQEIEHAEYKRTEKKTTSRAKPARRNVSDTDAEVPEEAEEPEPESEAKFYCRLYGLKPLIGDQADLSSYRALRKLLRRLQMTRIFDRTDAEPLDMKQLAEPGYLSVIDMSDCDDQQVRNIVIADLLARMYQYKMGLNEEENREHKVMLTIEEAHGFVSRERKGEMKETLAQLQRIARRGRKRWLALHFVTQSPQHLPSELFELANNKIIHQTTGSENLRVLKAATGTINEGIWDDVPSLGLGRAIVISPQYPHPIIARIRPAASRRNYMD